MFAGGVRGRDELIQRRTYEKRRCFLQTWTFASPKPSPPAAERLVNFFTKRFPVDVRYSLFAVRCSMFDVRCSTWSFAKWLCTGVCPRSFAPKNGDLHVFVHVFNVVNTPILQNSSLNYHVSCGTSRRAATCDSLGRKSEVR